MREGRKKSMRRLAAASARRIRRQAVLSREPFWWVRWVPGALLLLAGGFLAVNMGRSLLLPLLLSSAIAVLLNPLAGWFERQGRSRDRAVLLSMAAALLVIGLPLLGLLPGVWEQLGESIEKLPLALRALLVRASHAIDWMAEHTSVAVFGRMKVEWQRFQSDPSGAGGYAASWLSRGVFGLFDAGSAMAGLIVVPFFVYYLLVEKDRIREIVEARIPARYRDSAVRLLDETGSVLSAYVYGRCLMSAAMAAVYGAGLFALQVPLWGAISLVAGFLSVVPYLGALGGFVMALGFAALDGAGPWRLFGVAALFGVAQLIEDYVLTPRLIGNKLDLHPMAVLIALISAGDLLGLAGLVLAVPVLAVLRVILQFIDRLYRGVEPWPRPSAPDPENPSVEILAVPAVARRAPGYRVTFGGMMGLGGEALREWRRDNAPRLGAALAFYTVLSLAPLVVVLVAVAGFVFGSTAAQGQVAWQIQDLIGPDSAEAVALLVQGGHRPEAGAGAALVGMAVLFMGASSVVVELRDALNTIWGVPIPDSGTGMSIMAGLVKERFYSFVLVMAAGLLLLACLAVNTWTGMLGAFLGPLVTAPGYVLRAFAFVASFVVTTVLFGVIYRVLPDVHIEWRDVAIGAIVTSMLFSAGNQIIGLYLGEAGLRPAYGAAGSLVIVLIWVYYSAQIFFLGAEFTKVYSRKLGSHLDPGMRIEP